MDDGVELALRGFAARRARDEHELVALTTGPANLPQVIRRAVSSKKGGKTRAYPLTAGHGQGILTFLAGESFRPTTPVAPLNTGLLPPRSDGSILFLARPRVLSQLLGWVVDEVKRSSFQRKRFELLSRASGGLNAARRCGCSLVVCVLCQT